MAKPRETEPAADPLAALESAALAARHALDAKAAACRLPDGPSTEAKLPDSLPV